MNTNIINENEEFLVFVYGTLMKGECNHNEYLSDAEYIGDFIAEGFELYDLGTYPGVVQGKGSKVKGELYKVNVNTLRRLDILEEEGDLYLRKNTRVFNNELKAYNAYIYVYNLNVSQKTKISFENQPWRMGETEKYVWYASYGSNMLYERFLKYIIGGKYEANGINYTGCRDKTLPKSSEPLTIAYKMYFGNLSKSWEGGVSFLDINTPAMSLGRMYLITREQFEDVKRQEGSGDNWYNLTVSLGEYDGIEIVTITNMHKRPHYTPSKQYLNVIKEGLKETYPEMSDLDIDIYLNSCI